MAAFLIDEDLPRSLAPLLRLSGLDAVDVREAGLRGASDEAVFDHAVRAARTVITADRGFGNILQFPLGTHPGILIARFPNETPIRELNEAIVDAVRALEDDDLKGSVVVVDPRRTRVRKPRSGSP